MNDLQSCGVMELEEDAKATPSRYMNPGERPSIVRLNWMAKTSLYLKFEHRL